MSFPQSRILVVDLSVLQRQEKCPIQAQFSIVFCFVCMNVYLPQSGNVGWSAVKKARHGSVLVPCMFSPINCEHDKGEGGGHPP